MLVESQPPLPNESVRAIDARNAFIMERAAAGSRARRHGAPRRSATLKRPDLYGKTGTTNDSIDTWFNGFQPTLVAIVWMGYDNPRSLGDRETGGSLSLPVWINFMETALKGVPVMEPSAPEGVVNVGGEWYYDEYARGRRCGQPRRRRAAGKRIARPDRPAPAGGQEPDELRRAAAQPAAVLAVRGAQKHPGPVPELKYTPARRSRATGRPVRRRSA